MDDAILVSRAVGGDRDAFAAIYDRYAGAVLDLCTAVLRNADSAADATLDSFLRAAHELVNLRDRSQLRLWLLAVARHEATSRADKRRQEGLPDLSGDAPEEAGTDDPRRLVWDPAETLSEADRAVLHLHLRHELDGEELATVVGVRPAVAEGRAAKLRGMAETSVGALLLSRSDAGGEESTCTGLADVLEGWDGRFTPAIGTKIDRHARRCDDCRARRTMLLGRLRAMASLPFVPPPPWLRHEVLLRMELAVSSRLLPGWDEAGFPPGPRVKAARRRPPPPDRRRRGAVVGLTVLILAVAGGLLVSHDWDGDSTVTASGASTTTVSRPSPSTTVAPVTTQPFATVPATVATATTVDGIGPTTTVPAGPGTPAQGPPPVVPDREGPAIAFGAAAASAYVYGCPYSRTAVSADVSDRSGVSWVALFVRRPDGVEESVNMSYDGSRWQATMGDFDAPGQAVFWVEAIDGEGNRGRAGDQVLDVVPCS